MNRLARQSLPFSRSMLHSWRFETVAGRSLAGGRALNQPQKLPILCNFQFHPPHALSRTHFFSAENHKKLLGLPLAWTSSSSSPPRFDLTVSYQSSLSDVENTRLRHHRIPAVSIPCRSFLFLETSRPSSLALQSSTSALFSAALLATQTPRSFIFEADSLIACYKLSLL